MLICSFIVFILTSDRMQTKFQ